VTHTCERPIAWDVLVDYWADDLPGDEAERVEAQLFACGACTATSARVARIAQAMRSAIPPVVSEEDVAALRARGLVVEENRFAPGVRQEARFGAAVDILVHRLGGLDLSRARRVDVTVRIESTGQVILEDLFAPFDPARGEVLIACQRHFAGLPPDVAFDVRTHTADGDAPVQTFLVPHVFESR
jgi:hypothetical protein